MNAPPETSLVPDLSPSNLPPLTKTLGEFFASNGVDAFLVGGVVRDALLGRATGDIDVAVASDAEGTGRLLAASLNGHFVPLDEARGIVRVVVQAGDTVSCVDISSMAGGIVEDLSRRDFTIDAIAVSLADAATGRFASSTRVIDPNGGVADLRAGVIRSVAPSVFAADPARLLRAPRLAAQLGFEINQDTARRIRRDAHLVGEVAPERVRDELLKLLAEPGAAASLRCLDNLDLLCKVIPELTDAKGVTQPKEHHWDVFNHLIETVGQVERIVHGPHPGPSRANRRAEDLSSHPRGEGREQREGPGADGSPENDVPGFERIGEHFAQVITDGHTRLTLLKLVGLLHDIAKPATRTVEPSGRIRFLGHHTQGAEMAEAILKRLRLSGKGVELARLMVRHHLRPGQMSHRGELPTRRAIYRYYRDVGDAAIDTLYLNMADYLAARGPELESRRWSEHCRVIGHILREGLERKTPESVPKLIDGHDIMKAFCLEPGPTVGLLIGLVAEAHSAGEISTKDEAMELVKARLNAGGGGA